MNPREIEHYKSGLRRFRERFYSSGAPNALLPSLVSNGQKPPTMIVACCDSRVNPTDILNLFPGDAFVARTIANLIAPYDANAVRDATAAALEFGVNILNVQHIVLMGHSQCGGIQALLNRASNPTALQANSFINSWLSVADAARDAVLSRGDSAAPESLAKACEEETLRLSLTNLQTYPWIKARVDNGSLTLHAWKFDLTTGNMDCFDPASNKFVKLLPDEPSLKCAL